ncbi:hypothetical protein COOONC_25063 [Cooperia oncophora]
MKTDVTSRSVGTQSCLDLSDRNPPRPFTLHTQSSLDVSKPMKENKAAESFKRAETTPRDDADDGVTSKKSPTSTKPKPATVNKDKQRDTTAPTAESSSDTNHAPKLSSILPSLSENSFSDGDMTPPLSIVDDYNTDQQRSSPKTTETESQSQSTAPPLSQADTAAKTKTSQPKKKQRDYDSKIHSLSKEVIPVFFCENSFDGYTRSVCYR